MKHLLYIAGLTLALISCEKEDLMAQELTIITPEVTIVEDKEEDTTTVTSNTSSETTVYQGTVSNTMSIVGTGTATVTLVATFDDGKGTISDTYRVVNSGNNRVVMAMVNDSPHYNEGSKHWFFGGVNEFQVERGLTFVLYTAEFTVTNHRGIDIYHRAEHPPVLAQLDRALDLSGDNWATDTIYQFDELASIGGFAGLARNREFIVSIGGFETHVILHENGHNYDFENQDYMEQMTEIYPEGGFMGYYTGPVAEFRAEMFARYYLLRDAMPGIVRDLLDRLLN